jgi:hypothetical protein
MNATHASTAVPDDLHQVGTRPAHAPRAALLVTYVALVAQLAIWSGLAARVDLAAAFTRAHQGTEATVVVGGAIWLVQFTLAVVVATIGYRRYNR